MRILTIPIRAYSAGIEIQLPEGTFSEADWGVLMDVLQAMRPSLVDPDLVHAEILDDRDPTPDQRILAARTLRDEAHRLASTFPNDGVAEHVAELRAAADALDWFEREDTGANIIADYTLSSPHPISEHPGRRHDV